MGEVDSLLYVAILNLVVSSIWALPSRILCSLQEDNVI